MKRSIKFQTLSLSIGPVRFSLPTCDSKHDLTKTVGIAIIGASGVALAWYGVKSIFEKGETTSTRNPGKPQQLLPDKPYVKVENVSDMLARNAKQPKPRPLIGEEIYAGERVVISSETGVGKSILTTQLMIGLASGKPSGILPEEKEQPPMKVLLVDSEMDNDDWQLRYGKKSDFPGNLVRMEGNFNDPVELVDNVEETINNWTGDMALCIDNITNLFNTTSPNQARIFSNKLRDLQKRYEERSGCRMTIFVVTHDKKAVSGKPINNIMGSKNLTNFATKVLKLKKGKGAERTLLFPKSRKSDDTEERLIRYTKSNEGGWLHLKYEEEKIFNQNQSQDTVLQPQQSKVSKETQMEIYRRYLAKESINSLSKTYGVNRNTIKKYIEHIENGQI